MCSLTRAVTCSYRPDASSLKAYSQTYNILAWLLQLSALKALRKGAADYMDASVRGGNRYANRSQHGPKSVPSSPDNSMHKGWGIGGSGRFGAASGKGDVRKLKSASQQYGDSAGSLTPEELNGIFHSQRGKTGSRSLKAQAADLNLDSSTRSHRSSRSDDSHTSMQVNVLKPLREPIS